MDTDLSKHFIAPHQPDNESSLTEWLDWFWTAFLPAWIEHAQDKEGLGFFDLLDEHAQPLQQNRRTVLAQSRLLFTFSHLALLTNNSTYHKAARIARDALPAFRKDTGLYCRARHRSGQASSEPIDELAHSYDQSFVILGLVTWGRLEASENLEAELESCWSAIEQQLTDKVTGLLLEHDGLDDPREAGAPRRAQNPHMHLYEAALQAFEMTENQVWLDRAKLMRAKGLEYFFDQNTGTITEFIAPDLTTLTGKEGQWREIGHQCEWAWLLCREVELGGDKSMLDIAERLLAFADNHGFAKKGAMQGAAFDAVSCDTNWLEETFLLWPQTEAIKTFAIRKADGQHEKSAQSLALLIFKGYFANKAAFVNQLDSDGNPIWNEALSRLLYHMVLALTEGARAGLWKNPK